METSSECQMDFLKVYTKSQSYGRYCGSRSGISLIIPSSSVQLHFQSDRDSARKGFSITYKVIGKYTIAIIFLYSQNNIKYINSI